MASSDVRSLGLLRTTGIGVGAIVGGGILLLAGIAFQATGPSAVLAFALNGVVALLTALSFAEVSTSFPESGGAYVFAKKVLGVRAAFGMGWVLWFAYIVAGVLYAIGFAEFISATAVGLWPLVADGPAPAWFSSRREIIVVALLASGGYAVSLVRRPDGGGELATVGKVILFCLLIAVGASTLVGEPLPALERDLTPFFAFGAAGMLQAMGATFIALQGFDLVAAVAGEVREPERTIPRAMLLSLVIALVIYIPLLLVVATAGTKDASIVAMAQRNPATVIADAARNFMGPAGFWVVLVAALLSTLSALHANLLAASRVALTMARDRTLPRTLARIDPERKSPGLAIYATFIALAATLLMIPDLGQAGAAASLIFLLSFALAHGTAYLARRRAKKPPPFRVPGFPLVPVAGGVACTVLALYQAVTVPAAGGIVALWLGLGGVLYFAIFAERAEAMDAFTQAQDPSLTHIRGKRPLVLVPIANPQSAPGLAAIASALAPGGTGKVLLLTVLRRGDDPAATEERLGDAQRVVREALLASFATGQAPEVLLTTADDVWGEIARVARTHACESLVLGLSELDSVRGGQLEQILNRVDCEVVVARVPPDFRLEKVESVLVPIGGRGQQDAIRARLLGSLTREPNPRRVEFCSIVPADAPEATVEQQQRRLEAIADDEAAASSSTELLRGDDVVELLSERSRSSDLVLLGLQRHRGKTLFGEIALRIAGATDTATLMVSRRG